jgi:hypothetical protein
MISIIVITMIFESITDIAFNIILRVWNTNMKSLTGDMKPVTVDTVSIEGTEQIVDIELRESKQTSVMKWKCEKLEC